MLSCGHFFLLLALQLNIVVKSECDTTHSMSGPFRWDFVLRISFEALV